MSLFNYGVSWREAFSSYGKGLILFLKVRANLDWTSYMSAAECSVGELYKSCFLGYINRTIWVNDDTFLIPYVLEIDGFLGIIQGHKRTLLEHL